MPGVPRVEIAPGLEISRVLTGLWQIADMERTGVPVDPDEGASAMRRHVQAGLTTFDMADHYGSAELVAGAFERRWPDEAELLTKWVPAPGPLTPGDVRAAVERALARMGRRRLDLLQLHAWSYAHPAWLDATFWLRELQREGLVANVGVTNFDTAHLGMLLDSGVPVVSNQVSYSLIDRRAAGPMTRLCLERGVSILAYGTLAGGLLTERWLNAPEPDVDRLETWSQMKYARFVEAAGGWARFQDVLAAVHGASERLGVPMAAVASRWVLDAPAVAGVIVGARLTRSEHVGENARLLDFELDDGSRAEIQAALERLDPIPGDCGDEYRRPPFLTATGDLSHHVESFPAPYPVEERAGGRLLAASGTEWERAAGFARAVREGDRILVSGTTATHRDRLVGGDSPASQMHFCIDKIEGALRSLGGRLEDLVRTRVYVARAELAEAVSAVHGARLGHVRPANTLVVAGLVGEGYLVEMEAEAIVSEAQRPPRSHTFRGDRSEA